MRAVIFANGDLSDPQAVDALLDEADLILAADGGLHHLQALGLTPHALIGDFDSLNPEILPALSAGGVSILPYPARKDATDLELALDHAQQQGAREIVILGAMGTRWDQSLSNLLLAAARSHAVRVRLVDGPQEAFLVRAGETAEFHGTAGDTVSLVPLQGDALGVTTSGLEYPLQEGTLRFGSSRGVSNTLLGDTGSVHLKSGLLMCLLIHGPVEAIEKPAAE